MATAAKKKAPAKKPAKPKKPQSAKAPPKPGRPTKFTPLLAAELCRRMADGGHDGSLRKVCAAEDMPDRHTVRDWLAKGEADPEKYPDYAAFLPQYARACEDRAETILDEAFDIADDGTNDCHETEDGVYVDKDHIQRSKLRVEFRKWTLEKLAPKRYGAKVVQEVVGAGGGPVEFAQVPPRDYTDIRRKIAERRAAATQH